MSCAGCNVDLAAEGLEYLEGDDGEDYCTTCYEDKFCHTCFKCKSKIGVDSQEVKYGGGFYHTTCFLCANCNSSLAGKPFVKKGDQLVCAKCKGITTAGASQCTICKKAFAPGQKRVNYQNKPYHDFCFVCFDCKKSIGGQQFFMKDGNFCCQNCQNTKYASRCGRCGQVVNGGLTYKNQCYHTECFTCRGCNKPLGGQQFCAKDDQPYCSNCYTNMFSERCAGCDQPLTGRYLTFGGKQFHSQCFKCDTCGKVLGGSGAQKVPFYKKGDGIACGECIKA